VKPSPPDSGEGSDRPSILVVEPDDAIARELGRMLAELGVEVERVATETEAVRRIEGGSCEVAIVDLGLARGDVAAMITRLIETLPDVHLVALTPSDATALGVAAVRAGAADFVRLPLKQDEVEWVARKVLRLADQSGDDAPPSSMQSATQMIGASPAVSELRASLNRARRGMATVLIRGETGTGKELVARQLHELGDRRLGPFIKVHCAGLPETLLESELFGYEKGAFTGAVSRKPGRVELAEGGTLFLDEIGDISPAIQVKLLRLLQDREFERLGGVETLKADVRFVAATHRNLEEMMARGTFREDLFYRLNVISLRTPSLAERMEDFEALAIHFCHLAAAANGRAAIALDVDALDVLRGLAWPGNVRQLQNSIERLVVLATSARITKEDVERELERRPGALGFAAASGLSPTVSKDSSVVELQDALRKAERRALEKALRVTNGNRLAAARLLGISRRALYYKLREHKL
jgi:DNA-binding NtrC family response regulator